MSNIEKIDVSGATDILVPSGKEYAKCVADFEASTGVAVPPFQDRRCKATSEGRNFWKVRGMDIPGLIAYGRADVGMTGTDACMEYSEQAAIRYRRLGDMMCRFSVLAQSTKVPELERLLASDSRRAPLLSLPTSRPRMLASLASWQGLPFAPLSLPITGSVEVYADLVGSGVVADIVETGNTAQQNGLQEVQRLCFIFPELVTRSEQ